MLAEIQNLRAMRDSIEDGDQRNRAGDELLRLIRQRDSLADQMNAEVRGGDDALRCERVER